MKTVLIILGVLVLAATCQGRQINNSIPTIQILTPTQEAPEPTSTPDPTPTFIPTPTWTPRPVLPTATPRAPEPTPTPQRWVEILAIGWSGTICYDAMNSGDENPQGQNCGFTWLGYNDPDDILMVAFHNPPHLRLMSIQSGMVMELHWFNKLYGFQFTKYKTIGWNEAILSISYFMFCDSSTPQGDTRVWEIERIWQK